MTLNISRITIAGERSGAGKSIVAVGILLALKERGLRPQPFKVGPDFLDPMHHSALLDRPSRNPDTWTFPDAIEETFVRGSKGSGISVIEGVMGLYDGFISANNLSAYTHLHFAACPNHPDHFVDSCARYRRS